MNTYYRVQFKISTMANSWTVLRHFESHKHHSQNTYTQHNKHCAPLKHLPVCVLFGAPDAPFETRSAGVVNIQSSHVQYYARWEEVHLFAFSSNSYKMILFVWYGVLLYYFNIMRLTKQMTDCVILITMSLKNIALELC